MPLAPGARLGPFEVLATLGQGGMGEVYRARDTRLARDVALKILPEGFAHDPDRIARFGREAQLLAALSHPNIGGIYGLEEIADVRALVLELIEGPTLADRIAQGALPLEEALRVARQIAEALEAAHQAGVIHRDLKPANIKLRPDGTVKVLDFGLAKAAGAAPAGSSLSLSPTLTTPAMTQAGVILGTAAYMSPEQAKGRPVDRRADVWAFGVVLFEVLTGSRPFPGEDISDVMASVLAREPHLAALPADVPAPVRRVIALCLQKDPRARIHDMADLRLALDGAFVTEAAVPAPVAGPTSRRGLLAAAAAALLAAAIGAGGAWALKPADPRPVTRISHPLGDRVLTRTGRPVVGIARDGERVAYIADNRIFLRHLDEWDARPIPGTDENPSSPVFSPDGQWVGFWSSVGALKKIRLAGGTPVQLTAAGNPLGVSWGTDGHIVYAQDDGIWRVSENGGIAERIVEPAEGERVHGPQMLPGGKAVLFAATTAAGSAGWDEGRIVVQRLETGERIIVHEGGADPRYVSTGHLVYALGNTLFARPFDAGRMQARGGPVPVLPEVRRADASDIGIAQYAVAGTGTLVYASGAFGAELRNDLALADRSGTRRTLPGSTAPALHPRFNHDDSRIAVQRIDGGTPNIWIYEVPQAQWRQLTFDSGDRPVWTPDGRTIVYRRGSALWQVPADFSGAPESLPGTDATSNFGPFTWSPDGEVLLYGTPGGLRVHRRDRGPVDAPVSDAPALRTPEGSTAITRASFSPDGRWVAYAADGAAGQFVYLSPFPFTAGGHRRIVNERASSPVWSRAGGEIFLFNFSATMAQTVRVRTEPGRAIDWENPESRFPLVGLAAAQGSANYDVTRDGQRMVVVVPAGGDSDGAIQEIRVVVNWAEELKRLAPATSR